MKTNLLKSIFISLILLVGATNAWAWWFVPGSWNGWDTKEASNDGVAQMNGSNTITFYNVPAGSYQMKLKKEGTWGNGNYNNKSTSYIESVTNGGGNDDKITLSKACDLTFTITDQNYWNCDVSASDPTYYIKYDWNGSGWAWSGALTASNNYSCTGKYGGSASFDHTRKSSTDQNGTNTTGTTVNNPTQGDKCVFTYNTSTNALTITRCNIANKSKIYFDNSKTNWTNSNIYFVIGHDKPTEYSKVYKMANISNTLLWYADLGEDYWDDATYYAFIATDNEWDYGDWGTSNLVEAQHYTAAYTTQYDLGNNGCYYFTPEKGDDNTTFTIEYKKDYSSIQKYTAKQAAKTRNTINDASYTDANGAWPTTLKLKGTHLTGLGATNFGRNEISGNSSSGTNSYDAVTTGKITHNYSTITGNYIFEGWGTGDTPSTTNDSYEYNITDNTTVYAFFTKAHKVTYSQTPSSAANAPTTTPSVTSGSLVASGTSVAFTAQAANTGYTWKGWYDNNAGTGTALSTDLAYIRSISSITTIYACYDLFTYDITYNLNGGTGATNTTYNVESAAITLPTPTKKGYTFSGWYDTEGCIGEPIKTIPQGSTGNKTLYAKWTAIPYKITYELNGGTNHANNPSTYTVETETINLQNATKDGFNFCGWFSDETFTTQVTEIAKGSTGNITLYARWGNTFDHPHIYLNNANLQWDEAMILIGHEKNSEGYNQIANPVPNTQLVYFHPEVEWLDQTRFSILKAKDWEFKDVAFDTRITYLNDHIGVQQNYNFRSGYTYYVTGSVPSTIDLQEAKYDNADNYPSLPFFDAIQSVKVRDLKNDAYTVADGEWPATLSLTGTNLGATGRWDNTERNTITSKTSNDPEEAHRKYVAVVTGLITQTFSGLKEDYIFEGWGTGDSPSSTADSYEYHITENTTVYAFFTKIYRTVITLDQEGAAQNGTTSVTATYGEDMPEATMPTAADGYDFKGYYDAVGTQYYNARGASVRAWDKKDTECTLYPHWSPKEYTITYTNLGGATHSNPETYTIEDAITFAAPSERNGYVFAGWQPASIAVGTTGNITVTAKWTEKEANTIYLKPSDGWKTYNARFAVYCWESVNTENNRWIDMNSVDETKEYYVANIPVEFDRCNFVRLNPDFDENRWNNWTDGVEEDPKPVWEQTHDLTIPAGNHHLYDLAARTHMFFKPTDNWKSNSAAFEAYFWNNESDNEYVELTFHKDGIYYCLKNNRKNVLFQRKNPENGWDKWGKTNDLTVPTNNDNFFTITNDKWGGGSGNAEGSWSEREDDVWDNSKWTSYTFSHKQGDYRLVYVDDTNGAHPGHLITKQAEGTIKDTVSFFVYNQGDARVLLQQCTNANGGDPTWETISTCYVFETGSANPNTSMIQGKRNTSDLHVGAGCGVEESGVYNFVLQQTDGTATILANETHKYTGEFYIRTDVSDGGWNCFKQASNKMTYSSYAEKNTNFTHYFCKWIKANRSVRYTIANDYSYCISDTLDADNIIQKYGVSPGCLPADANVRFGWDSRNNRLTRAYIAGSGFVGDRFLVVTGNNLLKDADGKILAAGPQGDTDKDKEDLRYKLNANEDIFKDLGNWVYQVDVTAQNGTMINLTALYNGTIQYFKGAEGEPSYPLLASTDTEKEYKIRMIYNFKTNHLVVAWIPESPYDVQGAEQLGTDMLLIRRDQKQATQIQLNSGAEKINNIKTAYAVMTFTKTFVEDDEKPIHERKHYWVSFPFDVKISDVFGFSEYKDHWIMQAYDGAGRAANGLWADTDTYWRYITNNNFVMRKGQGYLLTLDVKKMLELDPVFANTEEVSLYFPSRGELDTITSYLPTAATVPAHTCTIERENRKIYDSHWNMIGVPGFADIADFKTTAPDKYLQELEYQGDSLSFYYAYIPAENSYEVRTEATTFQSMYSYMVQFAGTINWTTPEVVYNPQLVARRNSDSNEPEKLTMRLEIAQGEEMADQTFVQLQQEGATPEFDMNLDLTKIINSGANIYTLAGESRIQSAGNALPMGEAVVVPVGVKVDAEGEYTFRMPDGTEGMVVELVDYETNNRTNLLLTDYTVTLPKGTSENRFALHIQPQKDVVTSLENIGEGVNNGEAVNKYLIDGKLIIRTADGVVYDAQGKRL